MSGETRLKKVNNVVTDMPFGKTPSFLLVFVKQTRKFISFVY